MPLPETSARQTAICPGARDLKPSHLGNFAWQQIGLDFVSRRDFGFLRLQFHASPGYLMFEFLIAGFEK